MSLDRHAAALEQLVRNRRGRGEHDGRLAANGRNALIRARGQAGALTESFVSNQHSGGTIDDAAGVSAVMNVPHGLDLRVLLHGHGIETHLPQCDEGRLELGERLASGIRPHVLVVIEHDFADEVADWDDCRCGNVLAAEATAARR